MDFMVKIMFFGFEKEKQNLLKANIDEGKWIDAGCGQGAYTIPLATIVTTVLGLDKNEGNLERLQRRIKETHIFNIRLKKGDLTAVSEYRLEGLRGILFAFSLHYQKNLDFLLDILQEKNDQEKFTIVVIEYVRRTPVPWVPSPCPPEKIEKILQRSSDYKMNIVFQNDRYYIGTVTKN